MTRDELYINGVKADLGKTDISLNYKSNLLTDISKIVSNNSYTIKLPKTAKNLALIECSHIPSSASRYPYLKHKGMLLRNGIEIIKDANVVLLKSADFIEVALSWGNVTNFASVVNDGKKLTDFEYGTVEGVDWDVWKNSGIGSLRFPNVNYGVNPNGYHPILSVKWILNKIQEESRITFRFPDNKLPLIEKMIVPLLTKNDSQTLYDKYPMKLIGNGVAYSSTVYNYAGINLKFNGDSTQIKYGEIVRYVQNWGATVDGYKMSYNSAKTQIKGTIKASFTSSNTDINYVNIRIATDGSNILEFPVRSYSHNGDYWSVIFHINAGFDINEGQVLSLLLFNGKASFSNKDVSVDVNLDITFSRRGEVLSGEKFPFVPNLPDIKQIDFIKAVASMVGLFALPDGENGIKFIPFDNLSANKSKAVDWTDRVIMAYRSVTPRSLEYALDNIAQNNRFLYKEDDKVTGNYDGNIQIEDATIDYERDAIKLPFSACDTKNGVAYIPLYSYNDKGELQYNKANPRILLLNGTKGVFKGLEWSALIENNYQTYKGLINNAKVVTEYIRLNSIELRDLEMDVPVYLAQYGCYLAIIEIKTRENNICECKLLKM